MISIVEIFKVILKNMDNKDSSSTSINGDKNSYTVYYRQNCTDGR